MVTATLAVLVSAYREGPLVETAVRSALLATPNVLVCEGPAGPSLEGDLPATDYDLVERAGAAVVWGAWGSDAEKRTAMVREANRRWPAPLWGLWLDGDELLRNPESLADWVRFWTWQDEQRRLVEPGAEPAMGWPIRLVELDGAVALCRGKVVRVDLIDHYELSSSVFVNTAGVTHGEGNLPELLSENDGQPGFGPKLLLASELDRMIVPAWLVAEPYLVHRSFLRHPARSGLRLHHQEQERFALAETNGERNPQRSSLN